MGMTAGETVRHAETVFNAIGSRAERFACGHPCHFNLSRMSYVSIKC